MPFPVWLLIAFAFFYFAFIFWQYSKTPLRPFNVRIKEEDDETNEVGELKREFATEIEEDIRGYIQSANDQITARYRIGAWGFVIAGLTAIVSIFLT